MPPSLFVFPPASPEEEEAYTRIVAANSVVCYVLCLCFLENFGLNNQNIVGNGSYK